MTVPESNIVFDLWPSHASFEDPAQLQLQALKEAFTALGTSGETGLEELWQGNLATFVKRVLTP